MIKTSILILSMTDITQATDSTKEALLHAAAPIFARKGYALTRIRDIATSAGTNVAAVNYHFGSKEGLYISVLRRLISQAIERFPLAGPPGAKQAGPEQRFAQGVDSLIRRFTAAVSIDILAEIMVREMAHPTAALDQIVQELIKPQFRQMSGIVAELLGPDARPRDIECATFSVAGQCLFYLLARPLIERLAPQGLPHSEAGLKRLSGHITSFSLAGLRDTRRCIEEATP